MVKSPQNCWFWHRSAIFWFTIQRGMAKIFQYLARLVRARSPTLHDCQKFGQRPKSSQDVNESISREKCLLEIYDNITHSLFEISFTFVVWTCETFKNNFEIKAKLVKYLKGRCYLVSHLHFFWEFFSENCFCSRDIPKIVAQFWLLEAWMGWRSGISYFQEYV